MLKTLRPRAAAASSPAVPSRFGPTLNPQPKTLNSCPPCSPSPSIPTSGSSSPLASSSSFCFYWASSTTPRTTASDSFPSRRRYLTSVVKHPFTTGPFPPSTLNPQLLLTHLPLCRFVRVCPVAQEVRCESRGRERRAPGYGSERHQLHQPAKRGGSERRIGGQHHWPRTPWPDSGFRLTKADTRHPFPTGSSRRARLFV